MDNTRPIGFFDSGVGGISVLKQAHALLPQENFIYYGDSKNAPYGGRDLDAIRQLTSQGIDFLLAKDCKAVVVACNTATSAAIDFLRSKYELPVIGIEPALKVAVEQVPFGTILVLATLRTLTERKFQQLMERVAATREVLKVPLPGLVEIIEAGEDLYPQSLAYLENALSHVDRDIAAVVLGCTHYPFVKPALRTLFGPDIPIFDGSDGTARRLAKVLEERGLQNTSSTPGTITFCNSLEDPKVLHLCEKLMDTVT